jgi:hypothetical protein
MAILVSSSFNLDSIRRTKYHPISCPFDGFVAAEVRTTRIFGAMVLLVFRKMVEACLIDCSLFPENVFLILTPYLYLAFNHQQPHPSVSRTILFGKSSATPHHLSDTY